MTTWFGEQAADKKARGWKTLKTWFGEQAADKKLRGLVSFELYQLCEYRHRDAYYLAGLQALQEACSWAFGCLWRWSTDDAQEQQRVIASLMWRLQAAREAFAVAVGVNAAATATAGTSAARAEVEGLLDALMADVDRLVTVLAQAAASTATVEENSLASSVPPSVPQHERWTSAKGEPPIGVVRAYIDKVKDDLWALFELLQRTVDAKVALRDHNSNGFLDLLMRCVRMFFHFDGTRWQPSLLIEKSDTLTVLRLIDDPDRGMRRYLRLIQKGTLTSEVSDDIRTKYDTWSAYVLSFLDDNRAYLTRLHTEFEVIRKKERQSSLRELDAKLEALKLCV